MNTKKYNDFFRENKDILRLPIYFSAHSAGDSLYYDEVKNKVMIIFMGSARISSIDKNGTRSIIQYFSEGDVIFASFLQYIGNVTYSLEFTAPAEVLSLPFPFSEYENALYNEFLAEVRREAQISIANMNIHTSIISCRSTRNKLLEYFEYMSRKTGSLKFKIPISMAELADFICADRSAMLREIRKMCDDKVIASKNRIITIL